MTLTLSPEDRREMMQLVAEYVVELLPTAPANPLLTASQSAKRKGVSVRTWRKWVAAGYIKPVPEMDEARFPQNKVDALFSK